MKKINIFLGIGIGVVLIIGGWLIFSNETSQLISQEKNRIFSGSIEERVILVVDNGEGLPRTFETKFEAGMTAFDLLKEKTEELSMILRTKSYDIGLMIEAIGDKENGDSGKYWMYYVNEEMPMVASDKNEIKAGDKVEFKFEKSTF